MKPQKNHENADTCLCLINKVIIREVTMHSQMQAQVRVKVGRGSSLPSHTKDKAHLLCLSLSLCVNWLRIIDSGGNIYLNPVANCNNFQKRTKFRRSD